VVENVAYFDILDPLNKNSWLCPWWRVFERGRFRSNAMWTPSSLGYRGCRQWLQLCENRCEIGKLILQPCTNCTCCTALHIFVDFHILLIFIMCAVDLVIFWLLVCFFSSLVITACLFKKLEIRSVERGICPIAPLSHYLAPLPRYWASNISGSRPWPFRVTWRHWSRNHWNRRWSFPIGHRL